MLEFYGRKFTCDECPICEGIEHKKWVASITYNHKKVYLGRYAVKEEAILARLTKEVELYKEFSPQRELLKSLNL